MARDGISRERYGRDTGRYGSGLTDGERSVVEPPVPPPPATGLHEAPGAASYAGNGRPVAGGSRRSRRFGTVSTPGATTASPGA